MAAASVWNRFLTGQVHPDSSKELSIDTTFGKSAGKLWGPLDGDPVLALHGWQDCCSTFDRLIPLLPKNLLVVAVDMLGHGLSDHHPAKLMYNSLTYLMWIKELVDIFEWDTFILLAHSISVSICIPYVTIFQQHKVKKVIMLDLAYPMVLRPIETVPNFLEALELFEDQEAASSPRPMDRDVAIGKLMATREGLDRKSAECLMERSVRIQPDGKVAFTRDPRLNLFILMAFRYHSFGSIEDMLKRFRGEWLLILTTDSEYLKYMTKEKVARAKNALSANASRFEFLETYGGHYVHLVHPERIAAKIVSFLEDGRSSHL